MDKFYTGVGSRSIDTDQEEFIILLAGVMKDKGYIMRSGDASGADTAFQDGCEDMYETWISRKKFAKGPGRIVPTEAQQDEARDYLVTSGIIPHFDKMSRPSKLFHASNYYKVIGKGQESEVCFFCAPEDSKGEPMGGTRTAVMMCRKKGIPTFNLFTDEDRTAAWEYLNRLD